MQILYNIFIFFFKLTIKIHSLWSPKSQLWITGRKNNILELKKWRKVNPQNVILIHCASLGEYEQALPLIIKLKERFKNSKIILSLFSPSGYLPLKEESEADYVTYLPLDSAKQANEFIGILNPQYAFFIKYEFWFNHLKALRDRGVTLFYVSAIFKRKSYLYLPFFIDILRGIKIFFVQDEESKINLKNKGFSNVVISGDTRMERALQLPEKEFRDKVLEESNIPIILYGSIDYTDLKQLRNFIEISENYFHVIVPHDIDNQSVNDLMKLIPARENMLYVTSMGQLKYMYRYAAIAYIGGGFSAGIHNMQEAAVYGIPMLIGPKFHDFIEAVDFVKMGAASVLNNKIDISIVVDNSMKNRQLIKDRLEKYFAKTKSSSDIIMTYLDKTI